MRRPASRGAPFAEVGNNLVTGNWLHPAAFQVVVAAVKHLPRLEHFSKLSRHCILNEVVNPAPALRGQVLELLFRRLAQTFSGLRA